MLPSDLRDRLATLDQRDLVDFIAGLQGRDDAMDRRIAGLVAHLDASGESHRLFDWIEALGRRGFVDWRQSSTFANEIEDLLDAIEALATQQAREARRVTERLIEEAPGLIENADDSGGEIGHALRRAYSVWLHAAAREREQDPSETDWAERVRELHAADAYGLADDLLAASGTLLSRVELWSLVAHYEAAAADKPGDERARKQVGIALRAPRPEQHSRS